jgi:uncharacterized membrane protein YhaH (DUF805 family)
MKPLLRFLCEPRGTIARRDYLVAGLVLFAIKYLIDFCLTALGFGFSWWPTDYFLPRPGRIEPGVNVPLHILLSLIGVALPFIWAGISLTIKRLNDVGWPPYLAAFFFIPYLNLAFFALLSFKASRPDAPVEHQQPEPGFGGVFLVFGISLVSLLLIALTTIFLRSYGWGLFVGIPFFMGFFPGLLSRSRKYRDCLKITFYSGVIVSGCLLLLNSEGLICLLMAAPLALIIALAGVSIGLAARSLSGVSSGRSEIACAGVLLLPVLILTETRIRPEPSLFKVQSSLEIAAIPSAVWNHVITFPELPPPRELMFRAGIAYPIRAEIQGRGPGAMRYCVFSTGPFVEPIDVWDEPRLLSFAVSSNPAPMKELSPGQANPPHLHGFLESERGQFELEALPNGNTKVIGTTWYRHSLWPEAYWRAWSDEITHTIHMRVLSHIKMQAEENRGLKLERLAHSAKN